MSTVNMIITWIQFHKFNKKHFHKFKQIYFICGATSPLTPLSIHVSHFNTGTDVFNVLYIYKFKNIFLKPKMNIFPKVKENIYHMRCYFSSHTSPWVSLHTLALLQLFLRVLNSPAKSSFKGKKCTVEYIGVLTAFYFNFKLQIWDRELFYDIESQGGYKNWGICLKLFCKTRQEGGDVGWLLDCFCNCLSGRQIYFTMSTNIICH